MKVSWWRRPAALIISGLLLAMAGMLPGCAHTTVRVQRANQVSQYGITWKFDRDYPVGQFVKNAPTGGVRKDRKAQHRGGLCS